MDKNEYKKGATDELSLPGKNSEMPTRSHKIFDMELETDDD